MSQSKKSRIISRSVNSFLLLGFICALWSLFFQLYSLADLGEPSFKPIVIILIALLAVMEVIVAISSIFVDDEAGDDANSKLEAVLTRLSESLKESPKTAKDGHGS
jgi:hypothetical protein